jgi:hypothetical protein
MVYKFVKTRTLQWCDGCGRAIYEGEIAWTQGGARDDYRYICIDCVKEEAENGIKQQNFSLQDVPG